MSFSYFATFIFLIGITIVLLALLASLWRSRRRPEVDPQTASMASVTGADFGPFRTSSRLRIVRRASLIVALTAIVFHAFWALLAAGPLRESQEFALLKNVRDQRNRREGESNLRGWVFDRHREVRRAFAKYRYLDGKIIRDYPLGPSAAHLIGYSGPLRGEVQIERALEKLPPIDPKLEPRSWWEKTFESEKPEVVGRDLVLTADFDLQKEASTQLSGKSGAIVITNPQTGELLALASNPSFDPDDVNNDGKWLEISRDLRNRPLLNRALGEYYLPGSTLKLITASAALEARLDRQKYTCRSEGWTPPGSSRPIRDDQGEAHGSIELFDAVTHSCNQYFAQLGVEVDRVRLAEAASRFGMRVFSDPGESVRPGPFRNLWNTDSQALSDVLAPLYSTFVAGRRTSKYDLALESIGQGYVQLTPMQMAMIVSAVANKEGNVLRPMIELGREPRTLSQAMRPETASRLREMMKSVVDRGTAASAFASVRGSFTAGGKTGTAQRQVTVMDRKTGEPVTYRDSRGIERTRKAFRIDSWFVGFAPAEKPQVAIAVVVEAGGYGGRTAAPIAAVLLQKALATKAPMVANNATASLRRPGSP